MPLFATGNTSWDQGLNSLAGSLFPDPSKVAQAGYYGAETGKAQLDAAKLRDQQTAREGLSNLFAPPGQPPQADPTAGTPTDVPGPTPLAVAPGPAPTPPTPGTDGNPPPPDPSLSLGGTGTLHPGSYNPQGGPPTYAPPASQNGTPSPPVMTLPQIVAMGARAGYDANTIHALGAAWVTREMAAGRIDHVTGATMLTGLADPTVYSEDAATGRNAATNATTLANTRLVEGGATTRTGMAPQTVLNPITHQPEDVPLATVITGVPNPAGGPNLPYQPYSTTEAGALERQNQTPGTVIDPNTNLPVVRPQGQIIKGAPQPDGTTVPYQPYNQQQQTADAVPQSIVLPNGMITTATPAQLRANPNMGRIASTADLESVQVMGRGGQIITIPRATAQAMGLAVIGAAAGGAPPTAGAPPAPGAPPAAAPPGTTTAPPGTAAAPPAPGAPPGAAPGTGLPSSLASVFTPVPQTTDQGAAQTSTRIAGAVEAGDQPGAERIAKGATAAKTALTPPPVVTPPQAIVLNRFEQDAWNRRFPPPASTGFMGRFSDAQATPDPEEGARFKALEEQMRTGPLANNPQALADAVLDRMQKEGDIPSTQDFSASRNTGILPNSWTSRAGDFTTVTDARGVTHPAIMVHRPGGGTAPASTTTAPTPAPTPAPTTLSPKPPVPGAVPAPPGVAEGSVAVNKQGGQGIVRNGWIIPLAAAGPRAGTPGP